MKKIKKLLSLGLLTACVVTTLAVPAFAKSSVDMTLPKNPTALPKSAVAESKAEFGVHRVVAVDAARIRKGPGTGYGVACTVTRGTDIIIGAYTETDSDGYEWDNVVGGDIGVKPGWIRDDLLGYPHH
jgi:uncharacterized protein YgiM (DUF1202 family)